MNKDSNDWLKLGIFLLVIGLFLTVYSVSSYNEMTSLKKQVDFDLIDDNNELSTSEKYYKYLAISDFLNKKLDKNKNLPIKNLSCVYIDYAEHNALEMYFLTKKNTYDDNSRKNVSAGNIKALYEKLKNYSTCKNANLYKQELEKIIQEIEKDEKNKIINDDRMEKFLNGYKDTLPDIPAQDSQEQKIIKTTTNPVTENIENIENQMQTKENIAIPTDNQN